jgi:hypothetical protein
MLSNPRVPKIMLEGGLCRESERAIAAARSSSSPRAGKPGKGQHGISGGGGWRAVSACPARSCGWRTEVCTAASSKEEDATMPGRYSTSSQSADWLLTEEEIAVHRKKSREQAAAQAQVCSPRGPRPPSVHSPSVSVSPFDFRSPALVARPQGPQTGATPGLANILLSPFPNAAESPMVAAAAPVVLSRQSSGGGQQLSNDEAAALLLHHEVRIREICDKMYKRKLFKKGAAGKTEADENMFMTSITYFKRFYLYKSVEEASPTAIMLAAIYTATKIEEVCECSYAPLASALSAPAPPNQPQPTHGTMVLC